MRAVWDRFWDAPVLRARVTAFRVVFFGLLGLDLWVLMLPHAPRYTDGSFNVSHVPFLDPVVPSLDAITVTVVFLFAGFLALRIAVGLAERASIIVLAVIYSAVYFYSQLDSYQHHYLICLLLIVCCFVPFHELPGLDRKPQSEAPAHIRSLAMRLIYAEVSIVYFYTAVTKVDEHWLSGWALNRIISVESVRDMYASMNEALGWTDLGMYSFVAHSIMIWQFFVAVAFVLPRLRPAACITGPIFHILVEVIDLKIGWFSYYMIGIYYLLLFPDSWFLAVGRPLRGVLDKGRSLWTALTRPGELGSPFMAIGTAAACAMAVYFVPSEGIAPLAVLVAVVTAAALWPRRASPPTSALTRALAHAVLAFLMVGVLRASDAPYDYYRFWGGDAARRGQLELAAEMYVKANARRGPREPARHFQLARVYERLGRPENALTAYEEGLGRAPDDPRGQQELAALRRRLSSGR